MPLPIAHALVGASAVALLRPSSEWGGWKALALGAFLGVAPDFDYALNWLRVSGGGWHHGFTHSIPFAIVVGFAVVVVLRQWDVRSFVIYSAAFASHTLLDYVLTESRGVSLWWPFTNRRYKLRFPNPIDYTWSDDSVVHAALDLLKISFIELLIFTPVLVAVLLVRRFASRAFHS